ncbi:MAG: DUF2231 domain-containing protein [Alphaproteobacteria bacterium]
MERYAELQKPGAPTRVAVIRHPLHPMMANFPIAFLLTLIASDLAFLYFGDPFWARVSLWLVGGGTVMGVLAGMAGTIELLWEKRIRRRTASWSHFVAAVMLLSVAAANWGWRIGAPEEAIFPWGLALSAMCFVLVGMAGWLGGALVFEHRIGVLDEDE